jgi:hypothetical protein
VNAFQPIGPQARWRVIYEQLRKTGTGGVITYAQLGKALSLDPDKERHIIQMAMRRAADELEREDNHTVAAVPNEGYRVVEPQEHLTLARRHQKKAGRALARGHSKVSYVDLRGVDPEVRRALEMTAQAFALQLDFNRRFAVRQSELERTVKAVTEAQVGDRRRSAEDVAALRERIERLEREK